MSRVDALIQDLHDTKLVRVGKESSTLDGFKTTLYTVQDTRTNQLLSRNSQNGFMPFARGFLAACKILQRTANHE